MLSILAAVSELINYARGNPGREVTLAGKFSNASGVGRRCI
jgi:hypothetical protein